MMQLSRPQFRGTRSRADYAVNTLNNKGSSDQQPMCDKNNTISGPKSRLPGPSDLPLPSGGLLFRDLAGATCNDQGVWEAATPKPGPATI